MKILLLHNYYQQWGGEDAVFEMEKQLLLNFGHDVETLTFNNEQISSSLSKLKTAMNAFYSVDTSRLLESKIEQFKPDLIHVHNFFPLASPSIFYTARQYRIPVVMTLHNFRLVCANALLYREGQPCHDCLNKDFPLAGIRRKCYRNSSIQTTALTVMTALHKWCGTWRNNVSRYITLNQFARQTFLDSSLKLLPEQVVVKPNFIFDPYKNDSNSSIPEVELFYTFPKQDFLLFVGRLSTEKGVQVLLEAFSQPDSGLPPLKIVGAGPLEADVRALAEVNPKVEYLGFQEKKTIMTLMRSAKALILPSTCYENFPMTIVEALASGTPVIASRTGGLPDIIQEGENGFLFSVGSSQELLHKIKQLTQEDNGKLCHNARKSYLQSYTPEINHHQLLEIYQSVLS